jgi:tRNA (guanine-N7-)-methyltransferase
MRLRYVKNARELIENNPTLITDYQRDKKVELSGVFPHNQPLHLEIGMGKGQFIYTLAKQNPSINYLGIEKFDSAIVKALEKVIEEPLSNLHLLRIDAMDIKEVLQDHSVERIYLNFSDPWPKDRHEKRRLTSRRFLDLYQDLLTKSGELHFKTDNRPFFDYSLEMVKKYPMNVLYYTYDLHQDDVPNIMTEFEEKFSQKGYKINKLIATYKEDENG